MRLMVTLPEQVQNALWQSAEQDFRDPRQQAVLLMCEALQKRGLLPADHPPTVKTQPQPQPREVIRHAAD